MAAPIRQLFPDGEIPPVEETNDEEVFPPPTQPLDVVRVLLREKTDDEGHLLIRKWRGDFLAYIGPQWATVDPESLRKWLYERLEGAFYEKYNPKTEQTELKPWAPDKGKVDKLIDAMVAPSLLSADVAAPSWISSGESAAGLVPCLNGLVDVATQTIRPCTPDYFGTTAIPLDYNPHAAAPVEWLKFLRSIWPDVIGADGVTYLAHEIATLQQWFGYVLSGRLELQKMLLVVGPPRCGKGTIARILQRLVGAANCSAPTLAGIAQNFGLETSIGKTLMVVGDARLSQNGQETVVERLLSITGQDNITLDRKNKTAWTGAMANRIMILSNELPRFVDASGAIASRCVILKLGTSFLGREDTGLERRLIGELPAILKWALDGLTTLNAGGRLYEPPTHTEAMQEMYDLVSPISAFLRDVCDVADGTQIPFAELYSEYDTWCSENGRHAKNTAGFSSDLKTQLPGLKTDFRPRDGQGRRLPRQVLGLKIAVDWTTRVRSSSGWRSTSGSGYAPPDAPMPGY